MEDIIKWLTELVNFNSTFDTGDTVLCAAFAANVLRKNGINAEILNYPDGKSMVTALIEGCSEKKIILHAHLDTAEYGNENEWKFTPYRAARIKNCICGRGTVDCKGQAAVWLKIMCDTAKLDKNELKYSLMLILSTDEETGGEKGIKRLIEEHAAAENAVLVIGEGGGFPLPYKGGLLYTIQTGEKFERYDDGKNQKSAGQENGDNKNYRYIERQKGVEPENGADRQNSIRRENDVERQKNVDLKNSAEKQKDEIEYSDGDIGRIINKGIKKGFYSELIREYAADCASEKRRLDIRPLYDGTEEMFDCSAGSGIDKKLLAVFEEALNENIPGAKLLPTITPGYSDNRYFRALGIPVTGFFPFDKDNGIHMHAPNEYISIKSLELAYNVMRSVVLKLLSGEGMN